MMIRNIMQGFILTLEFEIKAANLFSFGGLFRLIAEPSFYSLFVVTALASSGGVVDPKRATFLSIGVIGIQCVRMMAQVIFRWTLERKWSLGCLKLSAGVPRLAYFLGMLCVPLISLLIQTVSVLIIVMVITSFETQFNVFVLFVAVIMCGLFWSALGCVITAFIRSYKVRDFVVSIIFTPLMFSAPTLYSLEQVPKFLMVIASVNPLTYQLNLLRSAADSEWLLTEWAIVSILTCVMCGIGFASTRQMRTVINEG